MANVVFYDNIVASSNLECLVPWIKLDELRVVKIISAMANLYKASGNGDENDGFKTIEHAFVWYLEQESTLPWEDDWTDVGRLVLPWDHVAKD